MAFTRNHVNKKNVAPASSSAVANQWWWMTRVLKKAGWKVFASARTSGAKTVSTNPASDQLNVTTGTAGLGGLTSSGSGMTIAAASNGRALVTGLTGLSTTMFNTDKGRFLVDTTNNRSYQIEEIVSPTSCRIDARALSVTAGSGLNWEIRDPTQGSAFTPVTDNWIGMQGPSLLSISLTVQPAVDFIRGEVVVQAATGARGEVVSFLWDSSTGLGTLILSPRTRGTGGGDRGWNTSAIAGRSSGASAASVGSATDVFVQIVIMFNATSTGRIFIGRFFNSDSNKFSDRASAAGCTIAVPPGGGGSGNGFPTFRAYVMHGLSTLNDSFLSGSGNAGNAQLIAADCIEEDEWSSDGSWAWCVSNSTYSTDMLVFTFQRMIYGPDGDIHPYVSISGGSTGTLEGAVYTDAPRGALVTNTNFNDATLLNDGVRSVDGIGVVACTIVLTTDFANLSGSLNVARAVALPYTYQPVTDANLSFAVIGHPHQDHGITSFQFKGRFAWIHRNPYGGPAYTTSVLNHGPEQLLALSHYAVGRTPNSRHHAISIGPWDGSADARRT